MTRFEKSILAVLAAVVALTVLQVVTGHLDLNDPRQLCQFRGGIAITDVDGRLTRCDFPVNITTSR